MVLIILMKIIKKQTGSECFFHMNPNPSMYVLQTRHDYLGSLRNLLYSLKLTRELFLYF